MGLQEADVQFWMGRLSQTKLPGVSNYSDNRQRHVDVLAGSFADVDNQLFPNGIFIRKIFICERLVYQYHYWCSRVVLFGEISATQQRYTEGREVIRASRSGLGKRLRGRRRLWAACNLKGSFTTVGLNRQQRN